MKRSQSLDRAQFSPVKGFVRVSLAATLRPIYDHQTCNAILLLGDVKLANT